MRAQQAEAAAVTAVAQAQFPWHVAHVISGDTALDRTRFSFADATLRRIGFLVKRVPPVPRDDPEVLDWERRFRRPGDPTDRSPRSAISLSLTHLRLWRSFPAEGEWLWVFEDDVMLHPGPAVSYLPPPHGRGAKGGAITWRWPAGGLAAQALAARCAIDTALGLGAVGALRWSPLLYLGACAPHHHKSNVTALPGGHTLRTCDSLCLHAYAVRRRFAGRMISEILARRERTWNRSHALYRYDLDVMLRGFVNPPPPEPYDGHRLVQPMCLDMEDAWPGNTGRSEGAGLMLQNHSLASSVQHQHRGEALVW